MNKPLTGEGKDAAKQAMRLLERQDRTERQLRDKLVQKKFSDEAVDLAIEYVKGYGYLDDIRFCQNYIRYGQEGKSRIQLSYALQKKGIDKDLIREMIEQDYQANESEQIRNWIEKKYKPEIQGDKAEEKMIGFLYRKGYRIEDIKRELLDIASKKV